LTLDLCRTFGCTPGQLDREDADRLLRLVNIARLGTRAAVEEVAGYGE
jgi:hypothetical protein